MKKRSLRLGLSLIPLVLCACSQDWSGGLESARLNKGDAGMSTVTAQALPVEAMSVSQRRKGQGTAFANHPDTGSLVHYASQVAPRRTGAYTWHAADLSEEHAFRAMTSGEMTFQAPDGTPIKLAYQRHIEHPDGNWSWVGEAADGQTAVITFGEEAVFGTIPQGNDQPPLRLTLSDGRAWVVSADKRLLAQVRNEATHPTSPDYLIPPKRVQAAGAASTGSGAVTMAAPTTAEASSSAGTVIDVLVGYTNGFTAARGSQSAAQTRIRNLVDITNQAYVSSQIDAELRLVHSMQVTFPDNTANEDALEKLTGFRAPSTQLTPDPAFNGLRQARETYGADLVVLVRKFNDPENDGCGIAWLLGGGESGITPSDEYFGYSVVSDGQDTGDDGKTYFCREETFAHEIGHNLGSQHDIENSKDDGGTPQPGAYAYSYGYKTGSSQGNFFTIMAYGDPGQTGYQVFSNPNITICGGRACGTASANVARSINNTAPIIAGFRSGVVTNPARVTSDFNGDGTSDILWRHLKSGSGAIWYSADYGTQRSMLRVTTPSWVVVSVADYDGDGKSDTFWRNRSNGSNALWRSADYATQIPVTGVADLNWEVAGSGDFDGDGKDDLLWRNRSDGRNTIWKSADYQNRISVAQVADRNWGVAGIGDFDGDGRDDILWRHASTGNGTIWRSGDVSTQTAVASVASSVWQIEGVGDFDGNGRADILWRNRSDGRNTIWRNGNGADQQSMITVTNQLWIIAAVGDYNGDGKSDVLWRNLSSGRNTVWLAANGNDQQSVVTVPDLDWTVQ